MIFPACFKFIAKRFDLIKLFLYPLVFMPFSSGMDTDLMIFRRFLYFSLPLIQIFGVDTFLLQDAENTNPASDQTFIKFCNRRPRGNFYSDTVGSVNQEHSFSAVFTSVQNGSFNIDRLVNQRISLFFESKYRHQGRIGFCCNLFFCSAVAGSKNDHHEDDKGENFVRHIVFFDKDRTFFFNVKLHRVIESAPQDNKLLPETVVRKVYLLNIVHMKMVKIETTMTLLVILFSFLTPVISAQKIPDFDRADKVAKSVPDSVTSSVGRLSEYFSTRLQNKAELIRAFYFWISNNISYDVANMYQYVPVENPATLIVQTLESRVAVCQGYSALFGELCRNAGITCYIVLGYTRQNGVVRNMNHTWILAKTDSSWTFYDPTWGAGFLQEQTFVKRFTNEYFMVKPEQMIKSHMPFDPIWQCLHYPVTPEQFQNQTTPDKRERSYFNYNDSIDVYNSLTKSEQYGAALRRIELNGSINDCISEYVRYLKQNIEIERINRDISDKNEMIYQYNTAVFNYNAGATLFNEYVSYLNKQFRPLHSDHDIRRMIDTCETMVRRSKLLISQLGFEDESMKRGLTSLKQTVDTLLKRIEEQQAFLREYLATPKADREAVIGRFRWEYQ